MGMRPTRRPASHLRGEVNRHDLEPDAAVAVAVPHFRPRSGRDIRDGLAGTARGCR